MSIACVSAVEAALLALFSLPFLGFGLGALYISLTSFYSAGVSASATVHRSVSEPLSPGEAPDSGAAIVTGTVEAGPDGTLVAPCSGTEAVGYRYRIDQETDGVGWWTVAEGSHATTFTIRGDTDRLVVDPDDEVPDLAFDDPVRVAGDDDLPEPVRTAFEENERFDLDSQPAYLASTVSEPRRYSDAPLEPGTTVSVYGTIESTDTGQRRIDAADSRTFVISDELIEGLEGEALGSVAGKAFLGVFLAVFGLVFTTAGVSMFLSAVGVVV